MRKRLLVLLMAVMMLVMSAAPALAAKGGTDRPKDPQPVQPPGIDRSQADRPEQARDPFIGRANRYLHGCEFTECF